MSLSDDEGDTSSGLHTKIIKNKRSQNVNEEIESIKPYRFRPVLLNFNIAPFFVAYSVWFFVWSTQFGIE